MTIYKRQSTTARISYKTLELIQMCCSLGEGVICRYRGKEVGVTSVVCDQLTTWDGHTYDLRQLTIRKTTITAMAAAH